MEAYVIRQGLAVSDGAGWLGLVTGCRCESDRHVGLGYFKVTAVRMIEPCRKP